jgi:hypothetical protein
MPTTVVGGRVAWCIAISIGGSLNGGGRAPVEAVAGDQVWKRVSGSAFGALFYLRENARRSVATWLVVDDRRHVGGVAMDDKDAIRLVETCRRGLSSAGRRDT